MFMLLVPSVRRATVINKIIQYEDEELDLKDNNIDLKINVVDGVEELFLEDCLKIIFESNPNVVFHTIQYSRKNKKIYFYTDTEISIESLQNKKNSVFVKDQIIGHTPILKEIKKIFVQPLSKDDNVISLYDIANLINVVNIQYKKMYEKNSLALKESFKSRYDSSYTIKIDGFNYEQDELIISFGTFKNRIGLRSVVFKRGENLYIDKAYTPDAYDIFKGLEDEILKIYEDFIKYKEFKSNSRMGLKFTTSNFLVDINPDCINVYNCVFSPGFELSFNNHTNKYEIVCNFEPILNELHGREEEFYKKTFVKIEDCPKWMQEELYSLRANQLAEEEKIENEEMKKTKTLELIRKLNEFKKQ